jgi:hypothetical protein
VNHPDEDANRPLHVAAECQSPAAIAYFLGAGADKDLQNDKGWTPMKSLQASLRPAFDLGCTFGLNLTHGPEQVNAVLDSTVTLMPRATLSLLADGWLPPRMIEMLHTTAEEYYEMYLDNLDS